jgi:oxidase EvaA
MKCEEVIAWIEEHKKNFGFSISEIPFLGSKEWSFLPNKTALVHKSGRFFSIKGYQATTVAGAIHQQPLIHQWEIGIQAFLIKEIQNDLQILMQAKTEPGNIGITQVSPTLQVTRSNLQGVHSGKIPTFAEEFLNLAGKNVIINQKYPELGNRYFKKWNENIVICVDDMTHDDNFKWIPFRTLKKLLLHSNVINNDARLVLSLLLLKYGNTHLGPPSDLQEKLLSSWDEVSGFSFKSVENAKSWLREVRKINPLHVEEIPLTHLAGWEITDKRIIRKDKKEFSIMQLAVESNEREVSCWDQPIVNTHQQGFIGMICQEIEGVLHVLFEASPQIGSHHGAELLPSVCFDGSSLNSLQSELSDIANNPEHLIGECVYSEEGGRFYQDDSLVRIALVETLSIELPQNYCWLTLGQIRMLSTETHFFSDEARGALAILLSHL